MMHQSRHRWNKDIVSPENITIVAAYKIDQCKNCGCLLIHKYFGGLDYRKTYLVNGVEFEERPSCEPKTTQENEKEVGGI